jgi:hypothetical protein
MYAALWRILPGPVWVRILILIGLLVAILAVLVNWVFPFIDHLTTPPDVTVGE